ncbi:MAG: hypothetical protein ACYTCV_10180 [Planctomycetota bacterium]|jgi:hypothetical protein
MYEIPRISMLGCEISDEDAITLRDDLLIAYPLDPTEPPIDPPIDPEPPEPPIDPVPPDPSMDNRTFRQVFGSVIQVPTSGTKSYPLKQIWINTVAGVSIAWKLPTYTGTIELRLSKASGDIHGMRMAVFSVDRGFNPFLAKQNWGNTALRVRLGGEYSGRTVFSNIKPTDGDRRWDLKIQAYVSRII